MLDALRKKLGILYTKIYYKHERDAITDFTRAISNARTALVFLPDAQQEFQLARSIVPSFQKKFGGSRLTVLVPEHVKDPIREIYRCEIVRIHEDDITPFFLPKVHLRRRIQEKQYDVAVDLNIQLHLPSAFLCRESHSKVRIGIAKELADTFYNVQLRTDTPDNAKKIYNHLFNCLAML
jgi:ADP-heptose:LPS heptosyltransferase